MKKIVSSLLLVLATVFSANAQGGYSIKHYTVNVLVNKDASLDITETIDVEFTESRHGIIRMIPYKYPMEPLPKGSEKADRQLESNGYAQTIIENINVENWNYSVNTSGNYRKIKIGDKKKTVFGLQQYVIRYRMLNAVNFFKDKAELYFNIIGDGWDTNIDSVEFSISLYDALPSTPAYFVATGPTGSRENNTITNWSGNQKLSGHTTVQLQSNQGVTVGIVFPVDFLVKQNYMLKGMGWLVLPVLVFALMFWFWKKRGKDENMPIVTYYYPPAGISPGIAGYIIDDRLDRRDLTALVPYWGAGGYLQVIETKNESLFGLIKNTEYEFVKLKSLPSTAPYFERIMFNGIFESNDRVSLDSLKNVLYKTMEKAKQQLEQEVDRSQYYEKYSRGFVFLFVFLGLILMIAGAIILVKDWGNPYWLPVATILSGIIIIGFGIFMAKKSAKGNELYQQLAGFKEFIKKVEKDRLAQFLKEDEHYFDKVLPYAIVFDVADTWKDKLAGLDVPPPNWYAGNYHSFNTAIFLNSLDRSMNAMSSSFYSAPSSSGSSGGSWSSGGGGFSGGGFGGGGGSSW